MSKKRLTVDDLLLLNCASISLKEAADVLNMGYKTVLKMAKQNTFPAENCLIKLNDNGEYSKYVVMRVKFISYITGLSYEEQLYITQLKSGIKSRMIPQWGRCKVGCNMQ